MGLADLIRRLVDPRPTLDQATLRKAKPQRSSYVTEESRDDGTVVLVAPLSTQGRGVLGKMARKAGKPDIKQFELEPIGAFVWSLCDGKSSFESISKQLRVKYKMSRLEADAALAAFLEMLAQRRLVTLMIPERK